MRQAPKAKEPENRIQLRIDSDASPTDHCRHPTLNTQNAAARQKKAYFEIGLSETLP